MAVKAALTGLFCAAFTFVVSRLAPMVDTPILIALSAVSGFLGSLFAHLVSGRPFEKD